MVITRWSFLHWGWAERGPPFVCRCTVGACCLIGQHTLPPHLAPISRFAWLQWPITFSDTQILITRCDLLPEPLPPPPGSALPARSPPFVWVQETVKPIQCDRYGSDRPLGGSHNLGTTKRGMSRSRTKQRVAGVCLLFFLYLPAPPAPLFASHGI